MLRSLNHFPPEGFLYHVAQTGWSAPRHLSFNDTVNAITDHHRANPRFNLPTDREAVAALLAAQTEARLISTYGAAADQWIIQGSEGSPPPPFMRPRLQGVSRGVAEVKVPKASMAIGLLLDFLGPSLKPVPHELAEKRAAICVICPNNQPGAVLDHIAGEALKKLLEYKAEEKLFTSHDDKLRECTGCRCNLRLKPHVELAYILENTTPEVMAKLTPFCWIKTRDS